MGEKDSTLTARTASVRKELLAASDLRHEFGLSRDIAYGLLLILPHIRIGSRYVVRRDSVETYLEQAAREGRDIRKEALEATEKAKAHAGGNRRRKTSPSGVHP